MTQLSDDLRFQNLPPEEVREQIRKNLNAHNFRYILIDHTDWYNSLTRCKHDIYNMPIFADRDCSERPRAVTEITIQKNNSASEDPNEADWEDTAYYIYNIDYVHQNISTKYGEAGSYADSSGRHIITDCDNSKIRYIIEYESICNPITMHHFYTMDPKDLTLLFKGQLMGQNKGSPFRHVSSVAGTYIDKFITDTVSGCFIKRSAPIIQLLSRAPMRNLQDTHRLQEILQTTPLPIGNEVAYKCIDRNTYTIGNKEDYEQVKEQKRLSAYYPVITAEMCKELIDNIPRAEIEFGCFGLGSAGTGVLDLLSRSTFFTKYLFADFDRVENKNLRNQWYTASQIGAAKTSASFNNFRYHSRESRDILVFNSKFQSINFRLYDFKYVMAAFDSIETRLEFLDTVTEETSEVRYLIDARYDDLTASVFFIDLQKPEEVEFYRKGLLSDKEAFDKQREQFRVHNFEEFVEHLRQKNCFRDSCGYIRDILQSVAQKQTNDTVSYIQCNRSVRPSQDIKCGSEECLTSFKEFYDAHTEFCNTLYREEETESSCVRQNFIDIYKYASTFVYDAIRIIEDNKDKPFTQVDVTTDPLPSSMILRR